MELLFFAQIRENIGHGSEEISLPDNVSTVQSLINYLRQRGANYQAAFENEGIIRVAVNQDYVGLDHSVTNNDEIAFFPPMTGG